MKRGKVVIVLATFNGEKWLAEQLDSICGQAYRDWTLLISDDGSVDSTLDIVRDYESRDQRIELLPSRTGATGHAANFEYLLRNAKERDARWIFLSDQDDIWESDKVAGLLGYGVPEGGLVFSDLELLTSKGAKIGSYLDRMQLRGAFKSSDLVRQNSVVGCSMGLDASLLDLALPFPRNLENHDWWLALCAAETGAIKFCPTRYVFYRQHRGNIVGLRSLGMQLLNFPRILSRQIRAFQSKGIAISELIERLEGNAGYEHDVLVTWRDSIFLPGRFAAAWNLISGPFRPSSIKLLLIQCLGILFAEY